MNFQNKFITNNFYSSDTLKFEYACECFDCGQKAMAEKKYALAKTFFIYALTYGKKSARHELDLIEKLI